MRCAVVVNDNNKVVGVVSQGDILQAFLNRIDTFSLVSGIANSSFVFFHDRDLERAAVAMHKKGITLIPILDENMYLSDVITIQDVFEFKRIEEGSQKLLSIPKETRRILVLIPARGGSKGIPRKNIYPINGKPLLAYTIEVFQRVDFSGALVVSTDDAEIKKVAERYRGVVVIDRPPEISTDTASTETALLHALDQMQKHYQQRFDYVITAQPTSPLRTPNTVKEFIEEFFKKCDEYDAQLTLTANYSDFWVKDANGEFQRRCSNGPRRRQDREPLYVENSCLYITEVSALRRTKSVLGSRCSGFVISKREGVDIDMMDDIRAVEAYLEE
jgi:CMP-N-acetylneuraminic acid synthetase